MAESMESRIFTRAGAYVIKCGGLAVSAYEREREKQNYWNGQKNRSLFVQFWYLLTLLSLSSDIAKIN